MEQDDGQEIELERKLDQLYRKVAGIDTPDATRSGEVPVGDRKRVTQGNGPLVPPAPERPVLVRKRAPYHIAPLGWFILSTASVLAVAAFFFLTLPVRSPDPAAVVGERPSPEDRPPGEGAILRDKVGRSYRLPPGAVVVKIEEAGTPISLTPAAPAPPAAAPVAPAAPAVAPAAPAPPAAAAKGPKDVRPTVAAVPRSDLPGGYAVQIRAYPENQAQNAKAYLEEIRSIHPEALLETVTIAGHGVWHRILLGDFASDEEAEEYRRSREMIRDYPNSFVQKKSGGNPKPKSP